VGRDDGINNAVSSKSRSEIFLAQRLDSEEIATHGVSPSGKSAAWDRRLEARLISSDRFADHARLKDWLLL
jgi:hypothetical protein